MKQNFLFGIKLPYYASYTYMLFAIVAAIGAYIICSQSIYILLVVSATMFSLGLLFQNTHLTWVGISIFLATLRTDQMLQSYRTNIFSKLRKPCSLTGTITYTYKQPTGFRYILTTDTMNNQPAHEKLFLFTPNKAKRFFNNSKITLKNILVKHPTKSPYLWFLLKEGMSGQIYATQKNECNISTTSHCNKDIWRVAHTSLSSQAKQLFFSLFLGAKPFHATFSATKQEFALWGISHYLARSGLHLVLCVLLLSYLFVLIPLPLFIKRTFFLLLLYTYYATTTPSTSILRATCAAMLMYSNALTNLPAHSPHLLRIVCIGMLLHNPYLLTSLDFQLTFGITAIVKLYVQLKHKTLASQCSAPLQ